MNEAAIQIFDKEFWLCNSPRKMQRECFHMAASKIIKQLLIEREKSVKQLDELFGISRQSMSNKMYIDNFSFDDVLKIVDYLDCDIKFVTRDKFLSGDFYEGKE